MSRFVLAVLLVAASASAERYSYKNCINAAKLYCRHQKLADGRVMDQVDCIAINARQCADCATLRAVRRAGHEPDELDGCREWLDGTVIRELRHERF